MDRYEKTILSLYDRHPSVQNAGFTAHAYKPGIEAMRDFDVSLGEPWRSYRCLHVAGTNGKGSVCSILAAALAARGYKVGLFTSPHILDFRERIKIVEGSSFRMIPRQDVLEFLDSVTVPDSLSFFEVATGMGFWWFRKEKVDFAVVEVGLGGRLDSTNVITPEVSIITSIDLDHCALLGGTRSLIAGEKAGIFKNGVPAVVFRRDDETAPVFERAALQAGSPLFFASEEEESPSASPDPNLELNMALACKALSLVGVPFDREAALRYRQTTGLRGRWEEHKTPQGQSVILDMGHNPQAMRANFRRLVSLCKGPYAIVYGIMADKDLDSIAPLMPGPGASYFLCAPAIPRALSAEILQQRLSFLRPDLELHRCPSVQQAVRMALDSGAETVFIGGSTFVLAEAIEMI